MELFNRNFREYFTNLINRLEVASTGRGSVKNAIILSLADVPTDGDDACQDCGDCGDCACSPAK